MVLNQNINLGWHFYRNYFYADGNGIPLVLIKSKEYLESEATEKLFKVKNREIEDTKYTIDYFSSQTDASKLKLYTTYPGLLLGSGYTHEVLAKGEFKLGFYFDHTTGLPIIPGSSIKGVLRSVFPQWQRDKSTTDELKKVKTYWIQSLIENKTIEEIEKEYDSDEKFKPLKEKIHLLELEIFEGIKDNSKTKTTEKYYSIYQRDIFHDAIIVEAGKDKKIVGTDSITPHIDQSGKLSYEQAMLKNPTPLAFLKVLPSVGFQFNFDLKDGLLTVKQKQLLFEKVLLTIGIGAKTNVGYGQFSKTTLGNPSNNQTQPTIQLEEINVGKTKDNLKVGDELDAYVINLKSGVEVDLKINTIKFNPKIIGVSTKDFKLNQKIKIKVDSIGKQFKFSLVTQIP